MSNLTQREIKLIASLNIKKYRKTNQLFLVEGEKMVSELLNSDIIVEQIYATDDWESDVKDISIKTVDDKELKSISQFSTPNKVVALAQIPDSKIDLNQTILVLDGINDPGNLGTIIRTADWFGINNILCSNDTVDCYSHKVVQSTMGSIFRMNIEYLDIIETIKGYKGQVYGALLDGNDINQTDFEQKSMIVIGSESHGIRPNLLPFIKSPITIPKYGQAESLNAAIATSIILNQFRTKCKI